MKTGTHNLGRNNAGQLVIAKVGEGGLRLHVGATSAMLSEENVQSLKEVLA
jgi:hypothetical protein